MIKKQSLKIGIGQINPTVGAFDANVSKILNYIEEAEKNKVDLLVFHELTICGYPVWDLANKQTFVAQGLKSLQKIATATKNKHLVVAVGFIDRSGDGKKNYNAIAVLKNGKVIHKQYKTLLPTYDIFLEEIFFEAETKYSIFKLNGVPIGTSICEDIWDDQYETKPVKILAEKGARVLINISASPYHKDVAAIRHELLARKAKMHGLWIVYANMMGGQDDLIFDGRSSVYDPKGVLQFQAPVFKEGLFCYEIDLQSYPKQTKSFGVINYTKEMYQALCLGLSDYVRKNGFKKVALGLSGGIDSAMVATIACDALGKDSVIGVGMPGPFSSAGSLSDAKALASNLGIEFRTREICAPYELFIDRAKEDKKERGQTPIEDQKITQAMENLQARLRGLTMMYFSNDENVLILTTGNKSELAMGYCTLYGDTCGGLAVLGDVYKTDVYRLARYRNSISRAIPEESITKPPSAELRPNQKDEDSLPPYDILDKILYLYIEKNCGSTEIIRLLSKKGVKPDTVRKVISAVDHNEYKRRQLPPLLRVTEKAWFGRRMPLTNHFHG